MTLFKKVIVFEQFGFHFCFNSDGVYHITAVHLGKSWSDQSLTCNDESFQSIIKLKISKCVPIHIFWIKKDRDLIKIALKLLF